MNTQANLESAVAAERIVPSPEITSETAPYWQAANEGRLLLRRCKISGKAYHYPREHSPFVGGTDTEWITASGLGRVYSFSVQVRAKPAWCIAYVELDEGPLMLSNLCGVDFDKVSIGQRVQAVFVVSANGQKVPMFTPCDQGA